MRHLSCCALLILAVGCDEPTGTQTDHNTSDAGLDSGSADSGMDSGSTISGGSGGRSGAGGRGGSSASGGRGGSGGAGAGEAGEGARGGAGSTGGTGSSAGAGSEGGTPAAGTGGSSAEAGSGGGDSSAGTGGTIEDAGNTDEPALLELMSFEGVVAQVATGQTIRATAVWRNSSAETIPVTQAVITARAPGATHEGGPYDDFSPVSDLVSVAAGGVLTVTATLLPRAVLGAWEAYPTYSDGDGVYHDFPGAMFTIVADSEYGTFENTIWPIAEPDDPPNDDRRFALACYTKSATDDSARCTARYGLGTFPYQVNPAQLETLREQCTTEGGTVLAHACPTNQMLQLCWEDTRSPAWSFSCEYYGDPDNKSPQLPDSAPDIIFYNENYRGRDPQ